MAERRERIIIEFDARGAALVRREIDGISRLSRSAETATNLLRNSLLLLGGGTLTAILTRSADTYTDIENRIRSVTDTQDDFNFIQEETRAIAERTRTPLEDNVLLYQRIRNATSDLKDANGELLFSNQELLRTQELINKAIITSGAGSIEASNALRQLTQGLASGALRGDEFRSVSEQIPITLKFIAAELGATQGELRKYAEEGKITNEVIVNAFLNASNDIEATFSRTQATIGQALVRLRDEFTQTIGDLGVDTGGTDALADGILLVARNTDLLVKSSLSLGAGYATLKVLESDRLRSIVGLSKGQLELAAGAQAVANAQKAALSIEIAGLQNKRLAGLAQAEQAQAQLRTLEATLATSKADAAANVITAQRTLEERALTAAIAQRSLAETEAAIISRRAQISKVAALAGAGRIATPDGDSDLNFLIFQREQFAKNAAKAEHDLALASALRGAADARVLATEREIITQRKLMQEGLKDAALTTAVLADRQKSLASTEPLVAGALTRIKGAVASLSATIAANPITFSVAAIAAGSTALFLYRDQIRLTGDSNATLGDSLRVLKNDFNELNEAVLGVVNDGLEKFGVKLDGLGPRGDTFLEKYARIIDITRNPLTVFTGQAGLVESGLDLLAARTNAQLDELDAIATNFAEAREQLLSLGPVDVSTLDPRTIQRPGFSPDSIKKITEEFGKLRDEMDPLGAAQRDLEATTRLVNSAIEAQVPGFEAAESVLAKYRAQVVAQFDPLTGLRDELSRHTALLRLNDEQQRIAGRGFDAVQDARRRGIALSQLDLVMIAAYSKRIDEATEANRRHAESRRQIEENARSFNQLAESLDPLLRAHNEFARTRATIDLAVESGNATVEEAEQVWRRYSISVRDSLDPLAAIARAHENEIAILQLGSRERDVFQAAQRGANELIEQGVYLTDRHILALFGYADAQLRAADAARARADAEEAARREASIFEPERGPIRERILANAFGAEAQRNATIEEANRLFAEGRINASQWRDAVLEAEAAAARASNTFSAGLTRSLIELSRQYMDGAAQIESVTVNTFRGMEDVLVNFVTTGRANIREFVDSVLADLARLAIQQTILAPITGGLSSLFGGSSANVIPSAKGNAFGGRIVPLAHGGVSMTGFAPIKGGMLDPLDALLNPRKLAAGGVLSNPTLAFIAEAGRSEAVLPLERTSNGDLGVKAVIPPAPQVPSLTGGSREIHVHIGDVRQEFKAPSGMSQQDFAKMAPQLSQQGFERIIKGAVIEVLNQEQRPGGTLNRQLVVN